MRRLTTFPSRAKAGVYLIKEGKDIVYIGHSRTDVYKTMYRHFQEWTHREQEVTTYAGQNLDNFTVRVIYCTPKQAEAAEKYLIKRHKPRDNKYKYDSIILLPYDKKTGKQINETPTAPNRAWKPDPRDMVQDYSDFKPEYTEPFDLFGIENITTFNVAPGKFIFKTGYNFTPKMIQANIDKLTNTQDWEVWEWYTSRTTSSKYLKLYQKSTDTNLNIRFSNHSQVIDRTYNRGETVEELQKTFLDYMPEIEPGQETEWDINTAEGYKKFTNWVLQQSKTPQS